MGPGGSGFPGAVGACALARQADAKMKVVARNNLNWSKKKSPKRSRLVEPARAAKQLKVAQHRRF